MRGALIVTVDRLGVVPRTWNTARDVRVVRRLLDLPDDRGDSERPKTCAVPALVLGCVALYERLVSASGYFRRRPGPSAVGADLRRSIYQHSGIYLIAET